MNSGCAHLQKLLAGHLSLAALIPRKTAFWESGAVVFEHPSVGFQSSHGSFKMRGLLRLSSQLLPIGSSYLLSLPDPPDLPMTLRQLNHLLPPLLLFLTPQYYQLKPLDKRWWLLGIFQNRFLMRCTVLQTYLIPIRVCI